MRILYFVLFLLLTAFSFSQQWCAPGSVWNYKLDDHQLGGTRLGYSELKFTGTEIVNGKSCHVISGYYKGILFNKYMPTIPATEQKWNYKFYTYQEASVIYISQGGRFDTLVNFNALPGDKWLSTFGSTTCVNGWNPRTVTDTGHVTINGIFLKTVTAGSRLFIEGIGGVQGFLFEKEVCYYDGGTDGEFTCFRSDNFPVYMSSKYSECANMVGLEESTGSVTIKVYPNPGDGKFNIVLPYAARVQVVNAQGRTVLIDFLQTGNNIIHLESEPSGFYLLELNDGANRHWLKLCKIN